VRIYSCAVNLQICFTIEQREQRLIRFAEIADQKAKSIPKGFMEFYLNKSKKCLVFRSLLCFFWNNFSDL